jgi:hypothetical protein
MHDTGETEDSRIAWFCGVLAWAGESIRKRRAFNGTVAENFAMHREKIWRSDRERFSARRVARYGKCVA